jgi:hypothetical protein
VKPREGIDASRELAVEVFSMFDGGLRCGLATHQAYIARAAFRSATVMSSSANAPMIMERFAVVYAQPLQSL